MKEKKRGRKEEERSSHTAMVEARRWREDKSGCARARAREADQKYREREEDVVGWKRTQAHGCNDPFS